MAPGIINAMHIVQKVEGLLEMYRRPDGRKWSGQEIDEATGGVVTRSYVTNLRKGRIESPGYEKLAAMAKAMGFPPELWFEEVEDLDSAIQVEKTGDHPSFSDRVNELFETMTDETTGKPYTNTEVARMSLGDLTEEEEEGIRDGSIPNPPVDKVVALASVFGVLSSYFLDKGKRPPLIDREVLEIFRDETATAIAHKSFHLPDHEKQM